MQPPTAAAAADKRRTITLTNRAPIRIVEDDWPVIAQGMCGHDAGPPYGPPYESWSIEIRVRKHRRDHRIIIHAKYVYDNPEDDEISQTVRVGRLLTGYDETSAQLWTEILAVGEDLRCRIGLQNMRQYVLHALDACFAQLPPKEM